MCSFSLLLPLNILYHHYFNMVLELKVYQQVSAQQSTREMSCRCFDSRPNVWGRDYWSYPTSIVEGASGHYTSIRVISIWYKSHFFMAFNILAFPHVPSDNLDAQVHRHAPPKALCQFNITRVTRQSGSMCRSNNHPSELIFLLFFGPSRPFYVLALVGPGPLSVFFFLSLAHCQP